MKNATALRITSAIPTAVLALLLAFGPQEVQAQCVKSENGITVELLANGLNSMGTFSYLWGVTYDAQDAWITSASFQTTGGYVGATGTEPWEPWTSSSSIWSVSGAALPGGAPAVRFEFTEGLKLQRERTFRFSYTTAFQDPVRVVVVSSDGTVFDETFTQGDCALLPVELVQFEARLDDSAALLSWATASETNNAGFEVHHAVGEADFQRAGYIEGAGTTNEAKTYSFRVHDLAPGVHRFRLKQVDFDGAFAYSPEVEVSVGIPGTYKLSDAYPNPFNPQTRFSLTVAQTQQVRVDVYDALGQRVAQLFDGTLSEGIVKTFTFEAGMLPSGVYMYRVVGENFAAVGRALLVK